MSQSQTFLIRPVQPFLDRLVSLFSQLIPKFQHFSKPTVDDLINEEAKIGGSLFGAPATGHEQEFFYHKNNIWIWHESWQETLPRGEATRGIIIRYKVCPDGVYKLGNDNRYHQISGTELQNFRLSAQLYYATIKEKLY